MSSTEKLFQTCGTILLTLGVMILFIGMGSTAEPYLRPILALSLSCRLVNYFIPLFDQYHDYYQVNGTGQYFRNPRGD